MFFLKNTHYLLITSFIRLVSGLLFFYSFIIMSMNVFSSINPPTASNTAMFLAFSGTEQVIILGAACR
jgi:hypothetical protein